MSEIGGRVLWGARNIFAVSCGDSVYECRIKGKILKGADKGYNPLAPGDKVVIETQGVGIQGVDTQGVDTQGVDTQGVDTQGVGMILERVERINDFGRWNKKRQRFQTIAANIDELVIMSSTVSPPFRPRFIDRALALGEYSSLKMRICVNKIDQGAGDELFLRSEYYAQLGYPVEMISLKDGTGVGNLIDRWKRGTILLLGQSGVGKSTLIQHVFPDRDIHIGEINEKYNKGRHTTVLAMSYVLGENAYLIDTPGIRELDLYGIPPEHLAALFVEFNRFAGDCALYDCRHVHEPQCAVKDAVAGGLILEDRYDSYINSLVVMEESAKKMKDWKFKTL